MFPSVAVHAVVRFVDPFQIPAQVPQGPSVRPSRQQGVGFAARAHAATRVCCVWYLSIFSVGNMRVKFAARCLGMARLGLTHRQIDLFANCQAHVRRPF